jgi:gliding motility-associated-like protein
VNDGTIDAASANTITINVTPVNDVPTATGNNVTLAEDGQHPFTTAEFGYADADNDPLSQIKITTLPLNGQLFIDADNDGVVDDGEEVVLDQVILIADLSALKYKPATHINGIDSFDYQVNDGSVYSDENATIQITITPENDPTPEATAREFSIDKNTTLNEGLASTVTDPEGMGLAFQTTPVVDVSHGTLTINADGTFTYIPNQGYVGSDTFTYQVCDGGIPQECVNGTVTLLITGEDENADSDGDGIKDSVEKGDNPDEPVDSDGDGTPDYLDTDSDGDGIPDALEVGADPDNPADSDGDGMPDFIDTDSDNDGVPDAEEAGSDPGNPRDTDGDGIPDFQEIDSDGDGIPDGEEDSLVIYEGFSPNNDGKNDHWWIEGIENYPNNSVQVFNRWGNKVFEVKGYNNNDRAWGSESTLGLVIGSSQVPDGTYFYIIDLGNGEKARQGYITVHR